MEELEDARVAGGPVVVRLGEHDPVLLVLGCDRCLEVPGRRETLRGKDRGVAPDRPRTPALVPLLEGGGVLADEPRRAVLAKDEGVAVLVGGPAAWQPTVSSRALPPALPPKPRQRLEELERLEESPRCAGAFW